MEDCKSILDTHSSWSSRSRLINCMVECFDRIPLLMGNPSALLFSLLYGAPVQSITGSNTLVVFTLFQLNSSCAIDCEHLGRRINRIN